MAFALIQAGATLQLVATDGTITTLTLPSGITLRQDVPPRWAVYGRYVVLVNTPSRPLTVDATGTVRVLTPLPPRLAPVVSGVSGGTLSGTYNGLRYTNVITDTVGNVIAESDYSPASGSVTIATQDLKAASIDISPDAISLRRMYRPTTNGAVLFQWVDLNGNVLTAVQDDLSDAGLSEIAAPILGSPPRLTRIAEFRDRLFGVGDVNIDSVFYTETGLMYAWSGDNEIPIPMVGSDTIGIVALLSRREALGVGRLNRLMQITGTGTEDTSGAVDLRVIKLSDECGFVSQEATAVYRDIGYFLWLDGVYQWDDNGLTCISDGIAGRSRVRSWFATDDYFDRNLFSRSFAMVDPLRNKYRLFLYDPDGVLNFVEFDLNERTWVGPHKTDAFTPTSAFVRQNTRQVKIPTIGGDDGGLYQESATAADVALSGAPYGIDYDVDTKFFQGTSPDVEQYFGELSMLGKAQVAGILSVTPRLGYLNANAQSSMPYDMRLGRQRLRRLGVGKLAQMNFRHMTVNEPVALYGFEIDDVHPVGRR